MAQPARVTLVLGTRPEAIKMAPVIRAFQQSERFDARVVLTGQHREMVAQVMGLFALEAQRDLALMAPKQTLTHVTCAALEGLRHEFAEHRPDLVLVQGDTTTAFAAALAAFYDQIPVGHVEAGLRTDNIYDPFPEEANRRLISQLAQLHFAPTEQAAANLQASGVVGAVHVTGNTVIDALLETRAKVAADPKRAPIVKELADRFRGRRIICVTAHRRENFGEGMEQIAAALAELASREDVAIIYPVHPNPNVSEVIQPRLREFENIALTEPLDYPNFVAMMELSELVLTDSGGIQEETTALGVRCLTMRDNTERPITVSEGTNTIVGADPDRILTEARKVLDGEMKSGRVPKYWDGRAAVRIADILERDLGGAG